MDEPKTVLLQFITTDADDAGDDEALLLRLGRDVEQLELGAVDYQHAEAGPDRTGPDKADAGLIEWVGVTLAAAGTLIEVVRLAVDWSQRAKRPVRVRIGDDELVLDETSEDQRTTIIEGFLDRHRSSDDAG